MPLSRECLAQHSTTSTGANVQMRLRKTTESTGTGRILSTWTSKIAKNYGPYTAYTLYFGILGHYFWQFGGPSTVPSTWVLLKQASPRLHCCRKSQQLVLGLPLRLLVFRKSTLNCLSTSVKGHSGICCWYSKTPRPSWPAHLCFEFPTIAEPTWRASRLQSWPAFNGLWSSYLDAHLWFLVYACHGFWLGFMVQEPPKGTTNGSSARV